MDHGEAEVPNAPEAARGDELSLWVRVANDVTDVLAAARGMSEAAPDLLRSFADGLGCESAALWVPAETPGLLERRWVWRRAARSGAVGESERGPGRIGPGAGLVGRASSLRRPLWAGDVPSPPEGAVLAIPALYGATVHGVVELLGPEPLAPSEAQRAFAAALGKQIGQFVAREGALRDFARGRRELTDLFEHAPVGVHLMDRDGRILRVNRAELDVLGCSREECVGRRWREFLVEPDVADELLGRLAADGGGEESAEADVRVRRRDGSVRWMHVSANVLREEGVFVHVRAFARDVTQAKEADRALRASEDRYRRLVEGARDYAIHSMDADGVVVGWNTGAERLFGHAEAEVLGRKFALSFTEEDQADDVPARLLQLAADEGEFRHEGWRLRRDGSRFWAEVVYTAQRDQAGRVEGISQLTRDMTERRWLEGLRRKSADLEAANRDVVDFALRRAEIVRSVAGAVDGPAADVEAAAARLRAHAAEGTPVARDVEALSGAVAGLRRALDDVERAAASGGARLGGASGAPAAAVDLLRLANEARDLLRETASARRVRVDIDVDPELGGVVADPVRLSQVFYNLLANAIRASRDRGRVALRVLPEGRDLFRVEVEDSGIGLAPGELAGAFEARGAPSGDASPAQGGGPHAAALPATQRIVEEQGGRVGAQSLLGRGSVFFAVLPRAPRLPGEVEAASTSAGPFLVVSGDPATRANTGWTISHGGFEVVSASTPDEAVAVGRDRRFEVVAVDLLLPGIGATELVAQLRSIGMSRGLQAVVGLLACPGVGAAGLVVSDLLPRPVPADRLFAALERARVPRGRGSRVAIVDGDVAVLGAASRTLEMLGYRAVAEPDGNAALRACAADVPSALLLSPFLHGMDPFAFLAHLRLLPGMRDTPVLLTVPRQVEAGTFEPLAAAAEAAAREQNWPRDLRLRPVSPPARGPAPVPPPPARPR